MNYAMFFTADGKAIHAVDRLSLPVIRDLPGIGDLPVGIASYVRSVDEFLTRGGSRTGGGGSTLDIGSHGCVGLSDNNARILFDWTPLNTTVEVVER
jgi:hypothetical protein